MRARRQALDPAWVAEASIAVQRGILSMRAFTDASVAGCYLAIASEVRTGMLVEECWRAGRTVAVPAWDRASGRYRMALLERDAPLRCGKMGVREPATPDWVDAVDVIIVPGLAFDPSGARLGHGGGYYDRILAGLGREPARVGVAFDFQVVDLVPADGRDERVDAVVTEKRSLRCGNRAVD